MEISNVPSNAAEEFNFGDLRTKFGNYCKDYLVPLESDTQSKSLDFASKILFEIGPNLHKEKEYKKRNEMIRFNFCYEKTVDSVKSFDVKTVLVSTFGENKYVKNLDDDKLILTFKQASMLATDIFLHAIKFVYTNTQQYLLTPRCRAIFSKDSIGPMAASLRISEVEVTAIINASTCLGGQYLDDSDMACAKAATICATKRMTNQVAREQVIAKVVNQYAAKKKQYLAERFHIFSQHALGGVPPGLDPDTLIEQFNNIQTAALNKRIALKASEETLLETVSTE